MFSELLDISPEETRLVNRKGTHYVALDTASSNLRITPSTALTPFCVWQRTGNTGYYYQEHVDNVSGKTYRYYLIASKAAGVSINRIEVGEDLNNITKWYDWDFGMAITEVETANGGRYVCDAWSGKLLDGSVPTTGAGASPLLDARPAHVGFAA